MATQNAFSLGLANKTIGRILGCLTDDELVQFLERDMLPKPLLDVVQCLHYGPGPSKQLEGLTIWSKKYDCALPTWVVHYPGKY
jgi:hypothetical protein